MVMPDMVIIKFIDERMVGNATSIQYSSGIPLILFLPQVSHTCGALQGQPAYQLRPYPLAYCPPGRVTSVGLSWHTSSVGVPGYSW